MEVAMPPKCVETIEQPSLADEEIVHSCGKSQGEVHHRNRHWLGYLAEPSAGNRSGCHPYRGGHGDRRQEINLAGKIGTSDTASYQGREDVIEKGIGGNKTLLGAFSY
jgi:hypothetical protein